jgi:hypothetical protein
MNRATDFFKTLTKQNMNDLNVMMIAKVQDYNSNTNTATMVPLHIEPNTGKEYQPIPNIPVGFFSIGGYSIKVQPKAGDIFIMLFCDYDIDNIVTDGSTKDSKTSRTHGLQDAIAVPLSINFLNNAFNAAQDLIISREGTSAYAKLTQDGNWILNGNSIKLGENASKRVLIENMEGYTASSKVYAE